MWGGIAAWLLFAQGFTHAQTTQEDGVRAEKNSEAAGEPSGTSNAAPTLAQPATNPRFNTNVRPFLQRYCYRCHGEQHERAGIVLNGFTDASSARADRDTWERVSLMLDAGAMPPEEHQPRPSEQETAQVIKWIESSVFTVDCSLVDDPGRVTIRRLNRAEYNNTIRDLVGVDFEPARDFPSDDVGYGFDNIGDVLSLSPLLLEKYMNAAERIVRNAIVTDAYKPLVVNRSGQELKTTGGARRGKYKFYVMNSQGSVYGEFEIPDEDEFIVRIEAVADQAGPEPAKMEVSVDGERVEVFEIRGHRKRDFYQTRAKLPAGARRVEAAFINDYYNPEAEDPKDRDRNLGVRSIELEAVNIKTETNLPESHRRIVFCRPNEERTVRACAGEILLRFATRAYRRPVTLDEIAALVEFVDLAVEKGATFERGIQLGVQAILVSPQFLFRVESDADNPVGKHRVGQYELASRLSYFLWSSMPDAELFELADQGVLNEPESLTAQVRRMLDDPKSQALVDNFASQWLNLRKFDEVRPNKQVFGTFDYKLQADMRRETELFFEHIMRDDRCILEFLDADYSFLNERLAAHYGIAGVEGEEFRKVSLEGIPRVGVLTQASVLTLTSDPTRTSPVKRGKWILENILGTPPPPPPPNVPALEQIAEANPEASLREQLEMHRSNPVCASCHQKMDPLGLALENFDGVGRWRETDGGATIDASGELPGGETFDGPLELMEILRARESDFARHLTKKMLTYALGRGLEYYDVCTVDQIADRLARDGYRFSTLVTEICHSDPFLMRRGDGENDE